MSASAIAKIRAGLAARGKPNTFTSLHGLIGAPATFADLSNLVHSVLNKRAWLKQQAELTAKKMAEFEARTKAELAEVGKTREERPDGSAFVQDLWSDNARKTELEKRVKSYRATLAAETAEARNAATAGIREAMAKLAAVRDGWTDPVAFLDKQTLADPRRKAFRDNLATMRPKALESALKDGVIAGDKAKVAACLDVLDNMSPEDARQVDISRSEAAAYAAGEDFARCQHFLASADLAVLESDLATAQIEGRRAATDIKLRIGKLRREIAAWAGEELAKPTEEETSEEEDAA